MAWYSTDERDIPPDYIKQICHKSRDVANVICILCDNGFCKSEFKRKVKKDKGFFVSRHLVVCPAHPIISYNMISPHDPNDDPESVVLKRKMSILHNYSEIIKSGLNT